MPSSSTASSLCVDASILIRLVIRHPLTERLMQRWQGWREAGRRIVAPELIRYEVTNAIHQAFRAGVLPEAVAEACLDSALQLDIEYRSSSDIHRRAARLARSFALPAAYDAHYLAVAEIEAAEFWTADAKLVRKLAGRLPSVHLVE